MTTDKTDITGPWRGSPKKRIAFAMSDLKGGGVQLVTIVMAEELLRRGYAVDFVVDSNDGSARGQVPAGVRVLERPRGSKIRARFILLRHMPFVAIRSLSPALFGRRPGVTLHQLLPFIEYLQIEQPAVLITTTPNRTLQAIWAARISCVSTRIIGTERNPASQVMAAMTNNVKNRSYWQRRWRLIRKTYPLAHAVVVVSDDMGRDLVETTGLDSSAIRTVYNPAVATNAAELVAAPVAHEWFSHGQPPVVLAAGRLVAQKDFATLIDAFALIARQRSAHLMILGEGEARESLEAKIAALGLEDRVALCGWTDNPYAVMSRASVFVLSSVSEGLPGALLQALASGCPSVSTDCPTGPREILEDGRYGELVPVGDARALADAVLRTMDNPPDREPLKRRGRAFTVERIMDQYEQLMFAESAGTT